MSTQQIIEIIPTNTCPKNLEEFTHTTKKLITFAESVQLDISDGKFTPVVSWPYGEGQWGELEKIGEGEAQLPLSEKVFYEVHLMVENPLRIGKLLARGGAKRIIAHVECFKNDIEIKETFTAWKAEGAHEVGLAVLMNTDISVLEGIISECDVVLVMSIARLGAQGAAFEERALSRIEELHAQFPQITIAVDGGVSETTIQPLARAGATRFSVGSAISKAGDPAEVYKKLLALVNGV
jgi:ribulose-phosphate 3-epimerase